MSFNLRVASWNLRQLGQALTTRFVDDAMYVLADPSALGLVVDTIVRTQAQLVLLEEPQRVAGVVGVNRVVGAVNRRLGTGTCDGAISSPNATVASADRYGALWSMSAVDVPLFATPVGPRQIGIADTGHGWPAYGWLDRAPGYLFARDRQGGSQVAVVVWHAPQTETTANQQGRQQEVARLVAFLRDLWTRHGPQGSVQPLAEALVVAGDFNMDTRPGGDLGPVATLLGATQGAAAGRRTSLHTSDSVAGDVATYPPPTDPTQVSGPQMDSLFLNNPFDDVFASGAGATLVPVPRALTPTNPEVVNLPLELLLGSLWFYKAANEPLTQGDADTMAVDAAATAWRVTDHSPVAVTLQG